MAFAHIVAPLGVYNNLYLVESESGECTYYIVSPMDIIEAKVLEFKVVCC